MREGRKKRGRERREGWREGGREERVRETKGGAEEGGREEKEGKERRERKGERGEKRGREKGCVRENKKNTLLFFYFSLFSFSSLIYIYSVFCCSLLPILPFSFSTMCSASSSPQRSPPLPLYSPYSPFASASASPLISRLPSPSFTSVLTLPLFVSLAISPFSSSPSRSFFFFVVCLNLSSLTLILTLSLSPFPNPPFVAL